jgi:hypothetical protein
MLTVYTFEIGAPGCPVKAPERVQCARKAQTLVQRVSGQTARDSVPTCERSMIVLLDRPPKLSREIGINSAQRALRVGAARPRWRGSCCRESPVRAGAGAPRKKVIKFDQLDDGVEVRA